MASAAAVAADAASTPLPDHEYDPVSNTTGTIRGVSESDDDDDDDDVAPIGRRKQIAMPRINSDEDVEDDAKALSDEDEIDENEEDKGLFGEGSEDDGSPEPRRLDDKELDSGDDLDRNDRVAEDDDMGEPTSVVQELTYMDAEIGRHALPCPSDGELYLLRMPRFLAIDPHNFEPQTFQPPTTDHRGKDNEPAPSTFSPYNTAMSTIRWRHSPSNPSELQSNARILRWADGSLTLQLANNPSVQYVMTGNALCPPQLNPPKPTPTSVHDRRRGYAQHAFYDPSKDSFTYLTAPNERSQLLRITNKLTIGLTVQPGANAADDALERLQNSLAAAVRGDNDGNGISFLSNIEDPELAKKKAEIAEKEKMKAQKRRENQEIKDREFAGRAFGKRGGLTVGGLEDDEMGMGMGRRGAGGKRPKPKRPRRGEIYSDDEDDYERRGRTREDDYEVDDFVTRSDEEEEIVEDDDDEDDDDGIREETPRPRQRERERVRERTPKRELDGEGDPDEESGGPTGSPHARGKRRRVVDEEDED